MLTCYRCKKELSFEAFTKDSSKRTGYYSSCKECVSKGVKGEKIEPPAYRICSRCKMEKPIAKFCRTKHRLDGRRTVCMSCLAPCAKKDSPQYAKAKAKTAARNKRVRTEMKAMLIDRLGGKCRDCGISPGDEWPIDCFDFHHRDKDKKEFNFSRMLPNSMSREEMIKEADGCDILCANCHRREHSRRKQVA